MIIGKVKRDGRLMLLPETEEDVILLRWWVSKWPQDVSTPHILISDQTEKEREEV